MGVSCIDKFWCNFLASVSSLRYYGPWTYQLSLIQIYERAEIFILKIYVCISITKTNIKISTY